MAKKDGDYLVMRVSCYQFFPGDVLLVMIMMFCSGLNQECFSNIQEIPRGATSAWWRLEGDGIADRCHPESCYPTGMLSNGLLWFPPSNDDFEMLHGYAYLARKKWYPRLVDSWSQWHLHFLCGIPFKFIDGFLSWQSLNYGMLGVHPWTHAVPCSVAHDAHGSVKNPSGCTPSTGWYKHIPICAIYRKQ